MSDDGKLRLALTAGIGKRMMQLCGGWSDERTPRGFFKSVHDNDPGWVCDLFWLAGIFEGADYTGAEVDRETSIRFTPDFLRFIGTKPLAKAWDDGSITAHHPTEWLVNMYVSLHCEYAPCLPNGREPFSVPTSLEPEIWSLVDAGLLLRSGGQVMWTDLVTAPMIRAGLWTHDGKHAATERQNWAAGQAALICADIPQDVAAALNHPIARTTALISVLRERWDGSNWTTERVRHIRPLEEEIALAKAVVQRFDAGEAH